MILKASQRGGAGRLAAHLLNAQDNDHIDVYEVSGFMADTLPEALREASSLSQGTHCKQFLFSVSLSPPETESVDTSAFDDAIARIEKKMGLQGQPRVVVIHEKEGRRHAHCVWSRIDTQNMRAINLPYFKNKLMAVSKELFIEHGWKLPQGFIDREQRNPLNFTREEWQQAKRLGDDPRTIKAALKECWSISKDRATFQKALEHRGYYLAKGDRRGYVAVDWRGEVYSLSRSLGQKAKTLKERLGDSSSLSSVEQTRESIDSELVERVRGVIGEIRHDYQCRLAPLQAQKARLKKRHDIERQTVKDRQAQRWAQETRQRQARMSKGLRGAWDRLTGKHAHMTQQNEADAYNAYTRDKEQQELLVQEQLQECQSLQQGIKHIRNQQESDIQSIKGNLFSNLSEEKSSKLGDQFDMVTARQISNSLQRGNDFDLST